jgi:lipoprotein-anchoring transpeptidase ErfK/SrfK
MLSMLSARRFPVLLACVLFAASCGTGSTTGSAAGTAFGLVEPPPTSSVPVTSTTSTTTTSAPAPSDPFETQVANIRPTTEVLEVFVEPEGEPAELEFSITNPTFWGNPLALMITDLSDDGDWLEVQVPVRPNGTTGWIRRSVAEISGHRFRAEVRVGERAVRVWEGEELVAETGAVVGATRSPTPLGRFFVNDFVQKWDGSAYGPWILSLSAFSEALDTFAGGVPVIAIHGTNRPELIGGAHSNGCIRIPNEVIELLAATVPVGTPVDIVA